MKTKILPTLFQDGKTDADNTVALGTGQLDLPAILKAAQRADVQHYYLEDESLHTATQVPESIAYLKNVAK